MRSLFPLPDLNADPRSPTHPNAYEDFPQGTRVLAIYPDTSSFYRGIVRHPPIPGTASGHPVAKATSGSLPGKYIVEFDDDNNQQQVVNWDLVFEVGLCFHVFQNRRLISTSTRCQLIKREDLEITFSVNSGPVSHQSAIRMVVRVILNKELSIRNIVVKREREISQAMNICARTTKSTST